MVILVSRDSVSYLFLESEWKGVVLWVSSLWFFLWVFGLHEGFKQPWRGFLERFEEADSGLSTLFFEGNN